VTVNVHLGTGTDPDLATLYEPMLRRATNRSPGQPVPIPDDTVAALRAAAEREGARLRVLTDGLEPAARLLGAADRTRYLTPLLHREMIAELTWPGDPEPDTGIEISALELDASEAAFLSILRRGDVMHHLAQWEVGSALGDFAYDRVASAAALAVVTVTGAQLSDFVRGGAAAEAVWIGAEAHGLAVQPMSPVFLYARTPAELAGLSEQFGEELASLRAEFRSLVGLANDEELVIVLRFTSAPAPSTVSRRDPHRVRPSGR
jgi:hypothetical protein